MLLIKLANYSRHTPGREGYNERACVAVISIKCQTHVIKTSQARFSSGQHPALEFTIVDTATGLAGMQRRCTQNPRFLCRFALISNINESPSKPIVITRFLFLLFHCFIRHLYLIYLNA